MTLLSNLCPFRYESTGVETRTNGLEPDAASRNVFAFHKPETLADWLNKETVKARLRNMPPLAEEGLRRAQITAIKNLEVSLARGDRRALIQMATGGGKTFTAEPASVLLERIRAERARAQEQKQETHKATNGASPANGQRRTKTTANFEVNNAASGSVAQRRRRVAKLAQGVSPGKG